MFDEALVVKTVPKALLKRVKENYEQYNMGLYDSFNEAVGWYKSPSQDLLRAFLAGDYREYIPSAYLPEYLDFDRYPLYFIHMH